MTQAPPVARPIGVLAAGIDAGAVAGLVAGGVGSRLAMRILALTSPNARGAITEAGEIASLRGRATIPLLAAGLAPLVLGGPIALIVATLIAVGFILARSPAVREAWNAGIVDVFGRAMLLAAGIFGLVAFARGALEILV